MWGIIWFFRENGGVVSNSICGDWIKLREGEICKFYCDTIKILCLPSPPTPLCLRQYIMTDF